MVRGIRNACMRIRETLIGDQTGFIKKFKKTKAAISVGT